MAARAKGAEYVLVERFGHLVNIEQPAAFDGAALDFPARHRGRGA